jgi:hypothetical protein
MIVAFSPIYGAVMGSYHFVAAERLWQIAYSAVKIPILLFATTALCLPGFFVINTVLGLRDDLPKALQAIFAGQAALSIALAALAPFTRFWYFSTADYRAALLFNIAMFTVATFAGHVLMLRQYRPLIRLRPNHRVALVGWLALYAFVGMQMGWILRPFVGDPDAPVAFLRQEPFTNAYIVIAGLFFG